jgi:hypothetical protein
MIIRVKPSVFLLAILCSILSGCATSNRDMAQVAKQLRQNLPVESAITKLETIKVESQSTAQHQLNLGYLQLVSGDYNNALINFEQAKTTMASLQAISLSENLLSATVNETSRSYSGWPTDQVLVHGMMAMAYLLNNDLNGARVEILQADAQMNKLAEAKTKSARGQLAFVRYLAGVIYELNDEYDSALISYRMALGILTTRNETIPAPLQQSLIDLTARVGLTDESKDYQKQFRRGLSKHYTNKQFIFAFDGVVTQMQQAKSTLWWDIDDVYLSVALPKFPRSNYVEYPFYVHSQLGEIETQRIESIEKRAREDLQARMPTISAMALARAGAKFQTVKELNKKDNVLGAFANVLTIISEVADLRHWSLLPSSIQIATSYETTASLQLSSRYGQQMVDATDGHQIEEVQEIESLESNLTNNVTDKSTNESMTADDPISTDDELEGAISRKHITKSMTAKSRALHEDILKEDALGESPTAVKRTRPNTTTINTSTKKNAVVLLSSLTNKIHIASF